MARAKQHSTPKKRPTKRGTAKVPKHGSATFRSDTADPVLLAIEDYKVAYAETDRAFDVAEAVERGDDDNAKHKADAAVTRAGRRQDAALYRVVTTKATTLAGLAEVAKFFGESVPIQGSPCRSSRMGHCRWDAEVADNFRSRPKMYFATLAAALHDIAARTEAGGAS